MMWLVKFYDNWADEMNMEGFAVFTYEEYEQFMRLVFDTAKKIDSGKTYELYFGTNEWNEYESGEEFLSCFTTVVLNPIEGNALKRLLIENFDKYGQFPSAADMMYFVSDGSEE